MERPPLNFVPHEVLPGLVLELADPAQNVADCRNEPGQGFRLLGWHDSAPLPDLGFDPDFRKVGLWESE